MLIVFPAFFTEYASSIFRWPVETMIYHYTYECSFTDSMIYDLWLCRSSTPLPTWTCRSPRHHLVFYLYLYRRRCSDAAGPIAHVFNYEYCTWYKYLYKYRTSTCTCGTCTSTSTVLVLYVQCSNTSLSVQQVLYLYSTVPAQHNSTSTRTRLLLTWGSVQC